MRFFRFGPAGAEKPGILDAQGRRRDLSGVVGDIDAGLLASDFARLKGLSAEELPLAPEDARLGPPLARVGKLVCIGLNYRDHAAESGLAIPAEPVVFMKATSSIVGPNDAIVLPRASTKVDWEVELGVVIGKEARYVSVEDALSHVAGVLTVNDVSERAFQLERGGTWDKGKGCDTFAPLGPYLVTRDEAGDLGSLDLWCDVNGQRMQNGNTRDLIFDVPFIIHYLSQFMSLQPGDVISTGTPAGVAMGMSPQPWLKAGDVVKTGVAGLGEQLTKVVPAI